MTGSILKDYKSCSVGDARSSALMQNSILPLQYFLSGIEVYYWVTQCLCAAIILISV